MIYTKQNELGVFGARWGCLATCLINVAESDLQRKLLTSEIYQTLGNWLMNKSVLLCNYKNHRELDDHLWDWSPEQNPEWHFYVWDREAALATVFHSVGLSINNLGKNKYIYEYKTRTGSHFVLVLLQGKDEIINPDPDINILGAKMISSRKVTI